MRREKRASRVESLLGKARRSGKIAATEKKTLRSDAMKNGVAWLKAHLSVRPKMVRSVKEGVREGKAGKASASLDSQSMSDEQKKIVQTLAADSGKTFDEFVADMNKTRKGLNR